jgi:hypothetical protein
VVILLAFQSQIAFGIRRGQIVDLDRRSVRHDDAIPDNKRTALAKGDHAVIGADQTRSLRDQKNLSCYRIEDILGHLRHDEAGQIKLKSADERGGDERSV